MNDYIPFDYLYRGFNEIQKNSASGLGEYISSPTSLLDLLFSMPYRFLLYVLVPLPWEMTGLLYIIGVVENYLLFIPLFIYVLINYKTVKNDKFLLLLLAFVFTNIIFYSSIMSNTGIVVRMKSHALFCLIIMFIQIRLIKKVDSEKNTNNK